MSNTKKYYSNKKNNSRGGKSGKFEPGSTKYAERDSVDRVGTNDIRWYSNNPRLLQSSSNFYYSNRLGTPLDLSYVNTGINVKYHNAAVPSVPGIMAINYIPVPGTANAINVAGKNIYAAIRSSNSGAKNYEWPDLMVAIFAVKEIFACIAHLTRVYGVARLYDQQNGYLPDALIECMGVQPDTVRSNYAQCQSDLNNLIARASVLWIPKNMPILERQFWMNTDIFKDGKSSKAQLYFYNQVKTYQWDATSYETGSALKGIHWIDPSTPKTWTSLVNTVNGMINAVIDETDVTLIMGDLLKHYGKENLYSLTMVDPNYTVLPVEDYEVLTQIHNLTTLNVKNFDIIQTRTGESVNLITDDGGTTPTNAIPVNDKYTFGKYILDTYIKDPTPSDNMIATRMMTLVKSYIEPIGVEDAIAAQVVCGTEICNGVTIANMDASGNRVVLTTGTFTNPTAASHHNIVSQFTQFDWAPILYSGSADADWNVTISNVVGDLDNYTTVSVSDMERIHICAVLSEYNVPYLP